MTRAARDHEVRAYFRSADYTRIVRWADVQDRSISNFVEHAVRRYMELIEEQDEARYACESRPAARHFSEDPG